MNELRAVLILAALARPAPAAVVVEAAAPLAAFVERVPALRAEAALQLANWPALVAAAPSVAAPPTAAAPAAAPAALSASAALLVSALAAQPDAPELHAVLGHENAPALKEASAAFARAEREAPDSAAALRVRELRRRWDLTSADGARALTQEISARLAAGFDGTAAPAASGPLATAERPRYDKLTGALAEYMSARGYARALAALEFARGYHRGRRKDGVTPEFQHQIEIALYLTTLKDLPDEEQTLTVALLHDVIEDYDVIDRAELARLFGADVERRVWLLTKTYRGEKKDPAAYFDAISRDPIASLVKGADRVHNLQSMVGVFTAEKQREYADEAERWFLPMLKDAERRFPEHVAAYRNIRHMIKSQLALIRAANAGR
jgi:hypothetical protein